jgi:pyrroloquinoline quinone biosynthesis protein B
MRIIVLGSAAGGGFPQWNSNAEACRRARTGDPLARARTQSSLAVSLDGASWFLLNAAPELKAQLDRTEALWPREGLRSSPIAGVVLTGGDVDAIAGLLTLRERHRFAVYATGAVHGVLAANPIFNVLARDLVERVTVAPDETVELAANAAGRRLRLRLFPVPGKVPLYMEGPGFRAEEHAETESTVGLELTEEGGPRCFFIPGCAAMTPRLAERLRFAPLVFFDGTLWTDDEMIRQGLGAKSGRRMGHMSMSGTAGVIAAFRELGVRRKVFVHINNSNPVLLADSAERREAEAAGWEIAEDGMEMEL